MAMVSFKRGTNLANLGVVDGQFIVNTAERAIYVDVGEERLRIGDFIQVATLSELPTGGANLTALYYVEDINCLCRHNGTEWIQINRDTGAVAFEVVGEGNVVTDVTYDATTRKLTLTKGLTAATPAVVDEKISTAVGALGNDAEGNAYANVKAYVDAKTSGIATDAALGELQNRVTTAEGEIDALQAAIGEGGSVETQIDSAIEELKLAETYEPIGKGAEEAAKVQSALDEYKTANDAAVKAAADAAGVADGKAVAAQNDVDALELKVGEVPADKTIVQMISEAQTAATYDDTQVKADIAANAKAIEDLEGVHSADKTELQGNIDKKADQTALDAAVGRIAANEGAIATLNGNAETSGSVDYKIAQAVASIMENPDETMNSINELVTWCNDHAQDALELSNQVSANKTDIANLATLVGKLPEGAVSTDVVSYIGEAIAALSIGDYAKASDLAAAVERIAALEGKMTTAEGKIAVNEGAISALDGRMGTAEGKITTAEGKIADLEGKAHEHANKDELDLIASGDKAKWDAAAEKAHTHTFVEEELNKIAEGDVAKWNAAQANAEATAAAALDAYKESNNAAVALKANAADVYAKTETYNKTEVDDAVAGAKNEASTALTNALTWGSF